MSKFTVTLSRYSYSLSFDTEEFKHTFSKSLITLALQSGENEIPIENLMVTPITLSK